MIETGTVGIFGGTVGILNVGAGDTKLSFDPSNPAERIRAARIVKDMIRRGYALLIEIERDGRKAFERATDFREDTCEYIIADFDPLTAARADEEETDEEAVAPTDTPRAKTGGESEAPSKRKRGRSAKRAIDASTTRAVAVARSAGG